MNNLHATITFFNTKKKIEYILTQTKFTPRLPIYMYQNIPYIFLDICSFVRWILAVVEPLTVYGVVTKLKKTHLTPIVGKGREYFTEETFLELF